MTTQHARIAVIGGSGLYNMPSITDKTEVILETPFGKPSAPIVIGTVQGKRVAFLPRHGVGHTYSPSSVPYRANAYALRMLGVRFVLGVSACGSLRESYEPGNIVIPHQLLDFTKLWRERTFFETGIVAHVSIADPFTAELRTLLFEAVQAVGGTVHPHGTYITIEGPRFSTRAESLTYRQWGCDIIGMTTSPEAQLCAEAQMAYAVMAHVTDYDVWRETGESVTNQMVIETMKRNLGLTQKALQVAIDQLDETLDLPVHQQLETALLTAPEAQSVELREKLSAIFSTD
ncbi:MAG: S-methyl-5'-thioadenosine phosphorylase [Phototrophicaceae bacterium]